jgi:hypothetical protein
MQQTGRELRRLLDLHATRNQQLQEVLLSDPAAAIAVFRELEHTRPGAFQQVADAAHAVSMIGLDPFRRLIDGLPEVPTRPRQPSPLPTPAIAYSQAAHAAFYAGALASQRGMDQNCEIPTAALLQNPAVLALWASEPESAQRATNAVRDGVPFGVAFGAELGEPLEQANQRLAAAWALPTLARQAMGDWDDFNVRPVMVKLGDGIAQTTVSGWQHEDTAMITALLSDFLSVSEDHARTWIHQRAGDAARRFSRMDYPLPGFELMFMPGEMPTDDDEDIPLLGARRPPTEPAANQTPDLHATMAGVMKRIREQAGTRRVVFAMLSRDRSRLRTRLALGGTADDGIRRLDLHLGEKNLFTALMGRPQSVWLNRGNAQRYQPFLPDSLRRILGAQGAFIMSLYIRNRPLGLMYGDGEALSEDGYRQFRELCHEATAVLGAGSRAAVDTTRIPQTDPS